MAKPLSILLSFILWVGVLKVANAAEADVRTATHLNNLQNSGMTGLTQTFDSNGRTVITNGSGEGWYYPGDSELCEGGYKEDFDKLGYPICTISQSNENTVSGNNITASSLSACQSAAAEATNTCDTEKDSSWKSAVDGVQGVTRQISQMAGMGGTEMLCGSLGKAAQTANAAVAAYEVRCANAVRTCQSTCSGVAGAESALTQCQEASRRVKDANLTMGNLMHLTTSSGSCQEALTLSGQMAQLCRQYPSMPSCGGNNADCSNPNSTHPVCVGLRNKNSASKSKTNGTDGSAPGAPGSANANSKINSNMNFPFDAEDLMLQPVEPNAAGAGQVPPGSGGANLSARTGDAPNSHSSAATGGSENTSSKVIAGYHRGGGAAGAVTGGGGYGANERNPGSSNSGGVGLPNFNQFRSASIPVSKNGMVGELNAGHQDIFSSVNKGWNTGFRSSAKLNSK